MLLSSNVIKQVSYELENCSVQPRLKISRDAQDTTPDLSLEDTSLQAVQTEADDILKNAQREAEALLQQTRRKIAVLEKEAYARGYQQGEQDAGESWTKAWEDFRAITTNVLHELEKLRDSLYRDTETDLIGLAVKMAEKLVCRQLDIHPDTIIDMIKEAINQARDCKEVVLYVPALQLESIIAKQGEIDAQLYKTKHFAIRSDPNIKCFGCRIETEQGYIDANLETMAEQLRKIFMDEGK